jgi:D-tagatose-1,6-bisphosphate aldolase subunit GatZ/KbaZ
VLQAKECAVTSTQKQPSIVPPPTPDPLRDIVRRHKSGTHVGITSVCSAHPLVLQAAVEHAHESGGVVLIEATSNQVDQTGGYTGMRPTDFRELVLGLAERTGLPPQEVILGGDHLGPNRWRHLPPEEAMQFADELVEAYVAAGFTKIHLDCSFSCAGDPQPLTDELVAERSARLIATAERCAAERAELLTYVIGTEVPVPGGAHETLEGVPPTSSQAARATLQAHRAAFEAAGVARVWPRVMALVVQPGVEFDHQQVFPYRADAAGELSAVLDDEPTMVFEAHSTDYQTEDALRALVRDHWTVLKVGPQLTFALREAYFGLAAIEDELVPAHESSRLKEVLEQRMLAEPAQWAGYYTGTAVEQRVNRRYSYSDRLRYYWPDPLVRKAQERLTANLSAVAIPLPLLSQYLPAEYERVRDGQLDAAPETLVMDHVKQVLRTYARACSGAPTQETSS